MGEFYTPKEEDFSSSDGKSVENRTIVHVKDTSTFFNFIIQERGLDPHSAIVRIAMDGGQGFVKVTANVIDPEESHSSNPNLLDSGVKRSFFIVEEVSEENGNLRKIIKPLQLQDVQFSIAFDLKCANASFGLSCQAGKFSCLFCEGECSLEAGVKRTLGSLDNNYASYNADGKKRIKWL